MENTIASPGCRLQRGANGPPHGVRASAVVGILVSGAVAAAAAYALTRNVWSLLLVACPVLAFVAWTMGARATTGLFLLLMPTQWLVIALLQFNGVRGYQQISALKEVFLVAAIAWFSSRAVRFRLALPDVLLMAALLIVLGEQLFHPDLMGVRDDWEWVLVYVLGRVLLLTPRLQVLWAKTAIWLCAVLAVAGAWEVLVFGPALRTALLAVVQGESTLPAPFLANGYEGFRAASTMVSPLAFSGLCMIGLILWWTYMRNVIPGILIAAGLVLTLTRSAILATVIGVLIVAFRRRELVRVGVLFLIFTAGLAAAIPALHLQRYFSNTFRPGGDTSIVGHQASVVEGANLLLVHPAGLGAGTIGPRIVARRSNALNVENSFLTLALEYGILPGVLFIAFVCSCGWLLLRQKNTLSYAALSILVGYAGLLFVGPLHLDIPLSCWVWVPVGLGIAQSTKNAPSLG